MQQDEQDQSEMESYRKLLVLPGLSEDERSLIEQLLEQLAHTRAENIRLRKTIHRLSASSKPKMSTKLKDALYE